MDALENKNSTMSRMLMQNLSKERVYTNSSFEAIILKDDGELHNTYSFAQNVYE